VVSLVDLLSAPVVGEPEPRLVALERSPVERRGCGEKSHCRVNAYDSAATYAGSKGPIAPGSQFQASFGRKALGARGVMLALLFGAISLLYARVGQAGGTRMQWTPSAAARGVMDMGLGIAPV
jgi:hypothetical protein